MKRFMKRLQDGNILELFSETELNSFDTEKSGQKTYDKVTYAKIIPPGGGNNEAIHEIKRIFGNKNRPDRITKKIYDPNTRLSLFELVANHVEEFEKGTAGFIEGTPIEDMSFIHPSLVGLLKVKNIHTVEILASVPDSALDGLGMGARELRDKAKYYLDSQKSNAPMLAVAAEKDAREKEIGDLKKKVEELAALLPKDKTLKLPKEAA